MPISLVQGESISQIFDLWSLINVILKNSLRYVVDNWFLKFGSKVFLQVIGIPTGSHEVTFDNDKYFSLLLRGQMDTKDKSESPDSSLEI